MNRLLSRLLIAERFVAPCARLSEVMLPLDVVAREPLARLVVIVIAGKDGATDRRMTILPRPELSDRDMLRLVFAPFDGGADDTFLLGVVDAGDDFAGGDTGNDALVQWIRTTAGDRSPIVLDCRGDGRAAGGPGLLRDEDRITAFRVQRSATPEFRTAHWIDAFWCDASGISLRGWVHAYEHRVRALRLESAGRSARVDVFADRPDLLDHYPEHEHVRHGGFAVYLACPPGHPAALIVETDAGEAAVPFSLPEGPIPAWTSEPEAGDTLTPLLRRFVELANARGGRVLQIGSRIPAGQTPVPPRSLLQHGLIGVDIHPGCNVDLVGDAHVLSHFIRERSVQGVLSFSVLEHVQAPWVIAAEINRVLEVGGLVYHHVPAAWPAHAQPNDFWRFSTEALRVLFGPATGFEVLETSDSGQTAIIPSPDWRRDFLDMPTIPAMAMAEIVARKVEEIPSGAVAWPLTPLESERRSHQYPVEGLRPCTPTRQS
ncbi:MAG TPA: methyltransferase domain-containing protein [Thermoanaerobaculia bacterium]|nr:methyltransferase domain-containing protein [Thermoanaerobaculia bacterium]